MRTVTYTTETIGNLRLNNPFTLSDGASNLLLIFETEKELSDYLNSLPVHEPVKNEIPDLEIEYSHDIPSKSLVIVKIKGHEPKELFYPEGFVWDDEWIINNVNIT